ncbi:hypothetical protein [Actinosynnema sp. ALI-1.44]|uniref:hypothetical protein n=1 Tax=Actinosynnema sp. ALI-1.44 TaxID=1933779 RepID=UPI00117774A3|nr:hypothetical protein [Actinosynnema sp. ALI-1.44]
MFNTGMLLSVAVADRVGYASEVMGWPVQVTALEMPWLVAGPGGKANRTANAALPLSNRFQ